MTIVAFLNILHFIFVLLFGLLLSAEIAGAWNTVQHTKKLVFLFSILLVLQGICWIAVDTAYVQKLYPLITHIPLVIFLVACCRKSWGVAIVSVCTAYLCCQIPHWGEIAITAFTNNQLAGELCYILLLIVTYLLLHCYFVSAMHQVITQSIQTLFLFGSLPVAYYIFDYATTVYSNALYTNTGALHEFLPTVLVVFYVLFLTAYHLQMQDYMHSELRNSMLELKQKQTHTELAMLRQVESQAAIYQHDMRHHLMMIESFLQAGKPDQASDYIHKTAHDIIAITPKRFCENEIVNLLCSGYADKAAQAGVAFTTAINLPKALPISDTDLCAILSNGIENALHAAAQTKISTPSVQLYCEIKHHNLLIEIRNPFTGTLTMQNGLPLTTASGHGYGCQSIHSIAERYHGHCIFQAEHNTFILRIVLPVT